MHFLICLGALWFLFYPFQSVSSQQLKVEVSAKSAILINADTGAVLYEKNAHQPLFPASITKMITALYVLEKLGADVDLNQPVVASTEAVTMISPQIRRANINKYPPYRLEFGGSHMGIKPKEVLPFYSLLYGLMLSSGNDAANVLAEYIAGDITQFMQGMNLYVKSKGCTHTHLFNPHGLPHPEHVTSAYDMALLAKEVVRHPLLSQIVKSRVSKRPATNMQPESLLHQHNALVKPGAKFYYPKATGIKTGYHKESGYTLVASAQDQNRTLIAVLLGCQQLEERYRDATALFEAAFQEKKIARTLFTKEFDVFSSQIPGGKSTLKAGLVDDLVVTYYNSEEQLFHSQVHWDKVSLPIRKADQVGKICINAGGKLCATHALFALNDVEPTLMYVICEKYRASKRFLSAYLPLILALVGCAVLLYSFLLTHPRQKR